MAKILNVDSSKVRFFLPKFEKKKTAHFWDSF